MLVCFLGADKGLAFLSDTFGLCTPLEKEEDVSDLKEWLSETWTNLAMVDYPHEANFLEPLPAWPVKVSIFLPHRLTLVVTCFHEITRLL